MKKNIIQLNNVCKTFQTNEFTVKAIDNISFDIEEGELVVILGASGAGKTTLLNLLGGMDSPTSGEIKIDNENIEKFNDNQLVLYRRNKIGFVFQFYNLISNLTALDNVRFASSYVKNPLDAKDTLNKVGLKERYNNFPSQLSGGEQQRAALARALINPPDVMLLDEPFSSLDWQTRQQIWQNVKSLLKAFNLTTLLVTHEPKEADFLADRQIHLHLGQLI